MVRALLFPKNVVILGATDKPGTWTERAWRNLHRYDYPYPVYPMNPGRDTVWDTRCYRSYEELPEPPDHVVVLIPARFVPEALREAHRAGARSATVYSAGFEEAGAVDLARDLKAAIEETGLAVSGPNCLGNLSGSASMMTGTDDRYMRMGPGPVSIIAQSGGIAMAFKRSLEDRGLEVDAVITSGNEAGLTTADYISYFAEDAGCKVVICYLESVRGDPADFVAACRKARAAGKAVVVLKLGTSDEGRSAAVAHTGALAGSAAAFDAIAGAAGAIRVDTTDDVVEVAEYLAHAPLPKGGNLAGVTLSGGMRGLLLDAAAAAGLTFNPLSSETRKRLETVISVGTSIGNPFDAGFAALTNPNVLKITVEAFLEDPGIDLIFVQEEIPRAEGSERKEESMRVINALAEKAGKPIVYTSMISHGITDYGRNFRKDVRNLAFLQECGKALRTVAHVVRHVEAANAVPPERQPITAERRAALDLLDKAAGAGTLDEAASKKLVAAYGIAGTRESVATSVDEAVAAADRIGYPVVAKALSAMLAHKSDAGGVVVGIENAGALCQAFDRIHSSVAAYDSTVKLDGILVSEMVRGGLELVVGATRDPEMGPVVLFGTGGVDLELIRDVATGGAPLDEVAAMALISRTRAGKLIDGYRGRAKLDARAAARALVGLSNLMIDAGDRIQSIDINPFVLRENGGVALDALVVLKPEA
jgi:acetyltransferase